MVGLQDFDRPPFDASATLREALASPADDSLATLAQGDSVRDPICGMTVDPATAKHTLVTETGETIYFCCPHCKARYAKAHA